MKTLLGLVLVALSASPSLAQQCGADKVSFAWSQPPNLPITDQDAVRWPLDASIRLAYGGPWCPDTSTARFERFEDDVITSIPAQIRIISPAALVSNFAQPLTVIEVDPIEMLEPRGDYRVVLSPPNPALALYEDYTIEFRTRATANDGFPDFEGILSVEPDGDVCGPTGYLEGLDQANPMCPINPRMRLSVVYKPLDKADATYVVYRTSSTPLDADGEPIDEMADKTVIPVAYEAGTRSNGGDVSQRRARIYVLYGPAPRRDCFAVRAIDEWSRERGDLDATACLDVVQVADCPGQMPFGPPSAEPLNPPTPGQACDSIGLYGAPAERTPPPIGGPPDMGVDASPVDVGVVVDMGEAEDEGSSGCNTTDTPSDLPWLLLALPLVLRRRR